MSIKQLREHLNLPSSKSRQVVTAAIRKYAVGGNSLIEGLTRLHELQSGRAYPDPALQTILDHLVATRDAMADYVLGLDFAPEKKTEPTLLGTMPDTALAQELGVSHTTIAKRRKALGIPPYTAPKDRVDWEKWDSQVARTKMTAVGLAELIGCDVSTVRERRRYLRKEGGKYAK